MEIWVILVSLTYPYPLHKSPASPQSLALLVCLRVAVAKVQTSID